MLEQQTGKVPTQTISTISCNTNETTIQENILKRKDGERESDDFSDYTSHSNSDNSNGIGDEGKFISHHHTPWHSNHQNSLLSNLNYKLLSTANRILQASTTTNCVNSKQGGINVKEIAISPNFDITLSKSHARYHSKANRFIAW